MTLRPVDIARWERIYATWERGESDQAIAELDRYLDDHPDDLVPLLGRAQWAYHLDRLDEAKAWFSRAGSVESADPIGAQQWCEFLYWTNDFDDLREAARESLSRFPSALAFAAYGLIASKDEAGFKAAGQELLVQIESCESESDLFLIRNMFLPMALSKMGHALVEAAQARLESADRMSLASHSDRAFLATYRDDLSGVQVYDEQVRLGKILEAAIPVRAHYTNNRNPQRRLRIGYVSGDFRDHVVSNFLLGLFANHDRDEFEVLLYIRNKPDEVTRRAMAAADRHRLVESLSPAEVADRIRSDKIDILVDLAGHTGRSLTPMLAMRPAPVQVNYLGYPASTGLSRIQYRLVDAITDPPGSEVLATEELVRLDRCFLGFQPTLARPPLSPALPKQPTMGTFNNLRKVNRRMLALWARLHQAIPDAKTILKFQSPMADGVRLNMERSVKELMRELGGDPERLEVWSYLPSALESLEAYGKMDFALDTMPYNGTTTTFDALSMGIPVLTLLGDDHRSRVSASILRHGGFGDWVAESEDEFVEKATDLMRRREELVSLRAEVRQRLESSELCDVVGHAQSVEAAYRGMWESWCEEPV